MITYSSFNRDQCQGMNERETLPYTLEASQSEESKPMFEEAKPMFEVVGDES